MKKFMTIRTRVVLSETSFEEVEPPFCDSQWEIVGIVPCGVSVKHCNLYWRREDDQPVVEVDSAGAYGQDEMCMECGQRWNNSELEQKRLYSGRPIRVKCKCDRIWYRHPISRKWFGFLESEFQGEVDQVPYNIRTRRAK